MPLDFAFLNRLFDIGPRDHRLKNAEITVYFNPDVGSLLAFTSPPDAAEFTFGEKK